MSCNGCRVLRKGCSDDCALRPCLQWIKTPEAQGNATVFLAKFYGRAGLINLINAGPDHLRHEVFRSLLYEACGRIINPIYGSVGLMCAGKWDRCQAAVEAVLQGAPIMQVHSDDAGGAGEEHPIMPLKGCDIRHLGKTSSGLNNHVHRVRARNRFKQSGSGGKVHHQPQQLLLRQVEFEKPMTKFSITGWEDYDRTVTDDGEEEQFELQKQLKRAPSHDSISVETVEPSLVKMGRIVKCETHVAAEEDADLVLDLTLGFNPVLWSQLSRGSGASH